MIRLLRSFAVFTAAICISFMHLAVSLSAKAETNIYVVLDGSGSMWGQVDGVSKVETALGTLYKAVEKFPEDSNAGLVAYGHRQEKNCQDVETLLSLSPLDKQKFIDGTQNFMPKGKTPIAHSLEYTAKQFTNNDAVNSIVLISDGIETCGGDPCATVKSLREEQGMNVDFHVIGFDLKEDDQKQLQCIAEEGNGKFINANNTQALEEAFEQVTETVKVKVQEYKAKPKPEIQEQVAGDIYFEDSFDLDLGEENWVVQEENPHFYVVSDGHLNIGADTTPQNIILVNRPLPESDWQATLKFGGDISTGQERFKFGLYEDPENFLMAEVKLDYYRHHDDQEIYLYITGKLGGKDVKTEEILMLEWKPCETEEEIKKYKDKYTCRDSKYYFKDFFKNNFGEIQLIKEGAKIKARAKFEYEYDKGWIETPELPLFKPFGKIGLTFSSGDDETSTAKFDHIKIENLGAAQ